MPIGTRRDDRIVTFAQDGGMFTDPVEAFAYAATLGATNTDKVEIIAGAGNFVIDVSSGVGLSLPQNCNLSGTGDYGTRLVSTGTLAATDVLLEIDSTGGSAENAVENIKIQADGHRGISKAGGNVLNLRRINLSFCQTGFYQTGGNVFAQGLSGVFNTNYVDLQGGQNFVLVESNPVLSSGFYVNNGDATGSVGCVNVVLAYNTFFVSGSQAFRASFGTNTIMADVYQGLSAGVNLRGTNASCKLDIFNMAQSSDMTASALVIDSGFVGTYNIFGAIIDGSAITLNGAHPPQDYVDNQTGARYQLKHEATYVTTQTLTGMNQVVFANSASNFTITLAPAADAAGCAPIYIKNINTNVTTIDGSGSETIDGELTQDLSANDAIQLYSTGTGWVIL